MREDDAFRRVSIPVVRDARGALIVAEEDHPLPFSPRRMYAHVGVPRDVTRGNHAHVRLQQVFIALQGAFTLHVDDGRKKQSFRLAEPERGLYVGPMVWRTLDGFSEGAVCLVLASEPYDLDDYIHDYALFLERTTAR